MSTHPALGAAPRLLAGVPRGDCVSSGASKLGWPSLPAPTAQDTQGSIAPESARCGRASPASSGRTGRTTSWSWLLAPQHTGTQTTRYTSSHVPLASRYRKTGIPSNFMRPWSTLPDEQGDRSGVTRHHWTGWQPYPCRPSLDSTCQGANPDKSLSGVIPEVTGFTGTQHSQTSPQSRQHLSHEVKVVEGCWAR